MKIKSIGMVLLIFLLVTVPTGLCAHYLYSHSQIISISASKVFTVAILKQTIAFVVGDILTLFLAILYYRKKFFREAYLKLDKRTGIFCLILGGVYVLLIMRQVHNGNDLMWILYKAIFYLVFVAVAEEAVFRGLMPMLLKGRVNRYLEWLLPSILFALSHFVLVVAQGASEGDVVLFWRNGFVGYVVGGLIYEALKRKSGTIWIGIFLHAIGDFGI